MIVEYVYNGRVVQTGGLIEKMVAGWAAATMFFTSIYFVYILRIPLIISIGLALVALDVLLNKRVYFDYDPGIVALTVGFLFVLAFGVVTSKAPTYGNEKLTVVGGWLVYFLMLAGYVKRQLPFFLKTCVVLGIAYFGLLIFQFGNPFSFLTSPAISNQRLGINYEEGGEVFNPIWLSRYIGVLVLSYLCVSERLSFRGILLYAVALIYIALAASKGPVLALMPAVLGYLTATGRISRHTCWMIVLVASGLVVSGSIAAEASGNQYLIDRYSLFSNRSGGGRFQLVNEMIADLSEKGNIWLGRGTGAAGYLLSGRDERGYPHNIFVEVFYENGVLGLAILLCLLVTVFIQGTRKKEWAEITVFAFFIYFFINSMFSGDLEFNQYLFLFGFTVAAGNRMVVL